MIHTNNKKIANKDLNRLAGILYGCIRENSEKQVFYSEVFFDLLTNEPELQEILVEPESDSFFTEQEKIFKLQFWNIFKEKGWLKTPQEEAKQLHEIIKDHAAADGTFDGKSFRKYVGNHSNLIRRVASTADGVRMINRQGLKYRIDFLNAFYQQGIISASEMDDADDIL